MAPSGADVAAWLTQQRVFISSVITGTGDLRAAVAEAVEGAGAEAVWFERFGGRDDDPEDAYLAEVAQSSIYVGILGERYGRPLRSGYSATHAEYDEARRRGLRVSLWVSAGDHDGRQTDFINEVAVFHTYGTYAEAASLAAAVTRRLTQLASEDLSPWAKLGHVVFRASRVRIAGDRIEVEATTRDEDVLAGLVQMGEPRYRSTEPLFFTHDFTCVPAQVMDITVETRAGNARSLEIVLARGRGSNNFGLVDVAVEGRSPEDLTELALRVSLFGETNPLGTMGFMATLPHPFEQLVPHRLSEEVIGAVIRVLLTESLVSSGRAERITSFRLGPVYKGQRRLAMSWLPRRRYTNVVPEERSIEGEVKQ